jgi:hypothetical protein
MEDPYTVLTIVNTLLACLAPKEVIIRNIEIAYVMAALSAALVSVSLFVEWRRKKFSWLIVYAPLLMLHPAWQLGLDEIRNGGGRVSADCFFGASGESIFLTAMLIAVVFVMFPGGVSKRLFLLRAMLTFWTIFALQFFFITALDKMLLRVLSHDLVDQIDATIRAGTGYAVILTAVCGVLYLIEALRKRRYKDPTPASATIEKP